MSAAPVRTLVGAIEGALDRVESAAWELRGLADRAVRAWRTLEADSRVLAADGRALAHELGAWPDRTARLAATAWLVTQVVGSYRLHAIRAAFLSERGAREALAALHAENARRFSDGSMRHGGAFLKVGQLLSARADLLPDAWVAELAKLQDAVSPVPFEAVREAVEADLGAPLEALFARFEPAPIGSASIAQVHRARLEDGRDVAVKVRRPGIEALLDLDLDLLEGCLASLRSLLPEADYATIAAEVRTGLAAEIDFAQEALVMDRVAGFFATHPGIVVPRSVPERCGEAVLTSTFCAGRRITVVLDAWAACRAEGDPLADARIADVLGRVLEAYARQILEAGVFQADPHPGNLLVDDRGRVVLLDFGCSRALGPATRRRYRALVGGFLTGDAAGTAACLAELGFATRSGRPDTLLDFADALLGAFRRAASGADLAWLDPSQLAAQARALLEASHGDPVVRIPEEFVMIARVFGTLGGLFQHYRPRLDARHLAPLLHALT